MNRNRNNKSFEKRDRQAIVRRRTEPEKAIVVGVGLDSESKQEIYDSLSELFELASTAGAEVVGSMVQILPSYNPATLLGSGKVKELKLLVDETGAKLVILDQKLSGAQTANLEEVLTIPVIDRTQLILDIFAQRARTYEGKLQVELAQMLDQLPRMVGAWMGSHSRLAGGIGTRGPGETALEMDRRRIREKVQRIRRELQQVQSQRSQHRAMRKRNQVPTFALVGYTNAGKSTLFNVLTKSDIYAKDQLFATLDPTTRKVHLPSGKDSVLTDTVGFIRRLPTKLIEAFKATLEESQEADFLLHVIDLSSEHYTRQIEIVDELVKELGWQNKPLLHVFNKADLATPEKKFLVKAPNRVFVSALTGEGIDSLKQKLQEMIENIQEEVELYFSNADRHHLFDLARDGTILLQEESSQGVVCKVKLTPRLLPKWSAFFTRENNSTLR